MSWDPVLFEDGQLMTNTRTDQTFANAKTWVDNTTPEGWRRGMFNHHQAGTCVRQPGVLTTAGNGSGAHNYSEVVFGASIQYASFGANGGSDAAGNLGSGDRSIVGHPSATGAYSGGKAEILYAAAQKVGMTNETDQTKNISGIEVLFNCEIFDIDIASETNVQAMFCIQYRLDSGATWYTLDESERFYSNDESKIAAVNNLHRDAVIRAWIGPAEVNENGNAANDGINGIRAMVSKYSTGGSGDVVVQLGDWNLSAIPWRASDV